MRREASRPAARWGGRRGAAPTGASETGCPDGPGCDDPASGGDAGAPGDGDPAGGGAAGSPPGATATGDASPTLPPSGGDASGAAGASEGGAGDAGEAGFADCGGIGGGGTAPSGDGEEGGGSGAIDGGGEGVIADCGGGAPASPAPDRAAPTGPATAVGTAEGGGDVGTDPVGVDAAGGAGAGTPGALGALGALGARVTPRLASVTGPVGGSDVAPPVAIAGGPPLVAAMVGLGPRSLAAGGGTTPPPEAAPASRPSPDRTPPSPLDTATVVGVVGEAGVVGDRCGAPPEFVVAATAPLGAPPPDAAGPAGDPPTHFSRAARSENSAALRSSAGAAARPGAAARRDSRKIPEPANALRTASALGGAPSASRAPISWATSARTGSGTLPCGAAARPARLA